MTDQYFDAPSWHTGNCRPNGLSFVKNGDKDKHGGCLGSDASDPSGLLGYTSMLTVIRSSSIDRTAAIDKVARFDDSRIGSYSFVGRSCITMNTTIS